MDLWTETEIGISEQFLQQNLNGINEEDTTYTWKKFLSALNSHTLQPT